LELKDSKFGSGIGSKKIQKVEVKYSVWNGIESGIKLI